MQIPDKNSAVKKEFVEKLEQHNPLHFLHTSGFNSDDAKRLIIQTLDPYVSDKIGLSRLAVSNLAVEAINVGRLSTRAGWRAMLDGLVGHRAQAWLKDRDAVISVVIENFEAIEASYERFMSVVSLETPLNELELDDFAFECFRNIGTCAESSILPHLRELLGIVRILNGTTGDAIASMDFGQISQELVHEYLDQDLITPKLWSLTVSQWRNVAQHHSYSVNENRIVIRYGKAPKTKSLSLTRAELHSVAEEIVARVGLLKAARVLSLFDHRLEIEPRLPKNLAHGTCEKTLMLQLAAAISTQGFKIQDAQISNDTAVFVVVDVEVDPVHWTADRVK
jgi:hypothetical protein